jgi:uncharacterized membrane protein
MVTGIGLTIPLIVTLIVVGFVVDFVANAVQPLVDVVQATVGVGSDMPNALVQLVAVLAIGAAILLVGVVAEFRSGSRIDEFFDDAMASIPGLGSVYTSFNQMSEMLLSNDAHSFQEVYLVEYPTDGSYTLAFLTADTPTFVTDATGHDRMMTLFMPMAPNPVMGGYVIHVAAENVYDVDMTVEEGLQSIVTSGVAMGDSTDHTLSPAQLSALGQEGPVQEEVGADPRAIEHEAGRERQ